MKKRSEGLNKRGQDLSIGTLILIILGIVVLVLLILGFSLGWGNLWEKINIFQGGSSVESVIQACNIAVSSGAEFTYCQDFKKIKIDNKVNYVNCQDSRVADGLSGTITCKENEDFYTKQQCDKLNDAERENVLVNGLSCPATGSAPQQPPANPATQPGSLPNEPAAPSNGPGQGLVPPA